MEPVIGRICKRLEDDPRIQAAYVFGSAARGRASRRSDLDIAVITDETFSLQDELRLRADLQSLVPGTEVDLSILDSATPLLRYEVVATGRRLFARDAEVADALELVWVSRYMDTDYFRRVQQELAREASG